MSKFEAAPLNTNAGGNGDALGGKGSLPMNLTNDADERVDLDAYRKAVPLWKRIHQHSLTQMMLLSVQAFCGPAMADAIAGLGGGGLATPQTSNIATAINYAMLATGRNTLLSLHDYLIFGGFFTGIGSGCWYVAESGSIMSLAPSGARGKYLALWIVPRNLGQLVGVAINLSKNHAKGAVGRVTPDTYIAFLIIESLALPFAFLISPLERVVRSDGTRVLVSEKLTFKQEFKLIKLTMSSKLILLSALWAVRLFFYR
ncbi:hypothetical protein AAE478_004010 [Parahypoxylon ruwenzoriense]